MSTVDLVTTIAPVPTVAPELQAAWSTGLTNAAATKIKPRWDAIVGDSTKWHNNVAVPSNAEWRGMVNPAFTSKAGRTATQIRGAQLRKLDRAFTKAKAAHDDMFADSAAKFDLAVAAKAQNWTQNVAPTLGLTGDRLFGARGPTTVHIRLASGDFTFTRDGGPSPTGVIDPTALDTPQIPYLHSTTRSSFRAAMEGKLIQYGTFLLIGELGSSDLDAINGVLDRILKGYVQDSTSVPASNFMHFELADVLQLHTHLDNADATPPEP
jgi:hypothetical protein